MKSLEALRLVVAQLFTAAKADEEAAARMSAQCDAMAESLTVFDWPPSNGGT